MLTLHNSVLLVLKRMWGLWATLSSSVRSLYCMTGERVREAVLEEISQIKVSPRVFRPRVATVRSRGKLSCVKLERAR